MQTKPEGTQALIPLQDSAQRTPSPQLYGEGSEQYEGKPEREGCAGVGEWFCALCIQTLIAMLRDLVGVWTSALSMIFVASPISMMCESSFPSPDWLIKS